MGGRGDGGAHMDGSDISSPKNEDSMASVLAEVPNQDDSDTGEGCGGVLRIRLRGSPQAWSITCIA